MATETPLARHLRTGCVSQSAITERKYREAVLEDAMEQGPQKIPSQQLRVRVAGYKAELSDHNF